MGALASASAREPQAEEFGADSAGDFCNWGLISCHNDNLTLEEGSSQDPAPAPPAPNFREIEAKLWAEVYGAKTAQIANGGIVLANPEQEADLAVQRFRERFGDLK